VRCCGSGGWGSCAPPPKRAVPAPGACVSALETEPCARSCPRFALKRSNVFPCSAAASTLSDCAPLLKKYKIEQNRTEHVYAASNQKKANCNISLVVSPSRSPREVARACDVTTAAATHRVGPTAAPWTGAPPHVVRPSPPRGSSQQTLAPCAHTPPACKENSTSSAWTVGCRYPSIIQYIDSCILQSTVPW